VRAAALAFAIVVAHGAARADDPKPTDAKPTNAKPGDAKPTDTKPGDAKPADGTKSTDDAKPADAKPADDTKPVTAQPGADGTKSTDDAKRAADTKPAAETKPADTKAGDKVIIVPAPKQKNADDDGEPRLSLPSEADRAAWTRSGFRLALGLVYGQFYGLRGAPSGRLLGPYARFGLRLDRSWSLLASFEYAGASKTHELSGLRFAGTVDPTWHPIPSLGISLGFGFAGIVEGRTGRPDAEPLGSTLDTSYTFPDASMPLPRCSGVGAAGLARVEWGYVLGPRSQTAVSVEALGQWTGCVDDANRVEPDTGKAIVRRQFWPHAGFTLSWGVTWR